jgi:diguanylate cyclase (GGDEF)-like protein
VTDESRDVHDEAVARLAALTETIRAVADARGTDDVLLAAARVARLALGGASVSVSRWERHHGHVRTIVNEGERAAWEHERPEDEVYSVRNDPSIERLVTEGVGYLAHVGTGRAPEVEALLAGSGKASGVDVPIWVDGSVWGDLWITRTADQPPFTHSDLDFAQLLAGQMAAAIAASRRFAQVAQLAYTDALTGLANRRAVDDRLDDVVAQHLDDGRVVSLVVCDVNGLKRTNDEHGHDAGDRLLVRFAGLVSAAAALVPGSLAGRLGGDEFCIVLGGGDADDAVAVATDLCRKADHVVPDGIACGVASTGDDVGRVDSVGRLFRLADAAQYRSKRSGSRRPVVAGRTLPVEATLRSRSGPRDRRRVRGRGATDAARLLGAGVSALDEATGRPARQRVEVVAEAVAQQVEAAGWWVSRSDPANRVVRTVSYAQYRSTLPDQSPFGAAGEVDVEYSRDDYPLTDAALSGGAFLVEVDDPYADPAEVALVDGFGCTALLFAGGVDHEGTGWLVEIYGDELSQPMRDQSLVLRALVALALAPR